MKTIMLRLIWTALHSIYLISTCHAALAQVVDASQLLNDQPIKLPVHTYVQGCVTDLDLAKRNPLSSTREVQAAIVDVKNEGVIKFYIHVSSDAIKVGDCKVFETTGEYMIISRQPVTAIVDASITNTAYQISLIQNPIPRVTAKNDIGATSLDNYYKDNISFGDRIATIRGIVKSMDTLGDGNIYIRLAASNGCTVDAFYSLDLINASTEQFDLVKKLKAGSMVNAHGKFLLESPCSGAFQIDRIAE